MRWILRGLAVVAGILVLALVVVYAGSEWIIRKQHAVPIADIDVPHDAASIAEGGRIARIVHCRDCHGHQGEGHVIFDVPLVGRVAPPPLAEAAVTLTDAELARAIHHGVHKDGTTLFVMPTQALSHLSAQDTGRVIAWIRSLKPGSQDSKLRTAFGPMGRGLILAGKLPVMANSARLYEEKRPADIGRYLVDVSCLACHKLHAAGTMEDGTTKVPALAPMAASYDPQAFRHLMRTGEAMGKRDLGLMGKIARAGLVALTDQEIAAIQNYLKAEAEKTPPQ